MDDQIAAGPDGTEVASEPAQPGRITGTLVTETFDYNGGRRVSAYVPPDPPEAVVYAGDAAS